jgi:hypothetical protein
MGERANFISGKSLSLPNSRIRNSSDEWVESYLAYSVYALCPPYTYSQWDILATLCQSTSRQLMPAKDTESTNCTSKMSHPKNTTVELG